MSFYLHYRRKTQPLGRERFFLSFIIINLARLSFRATFHHSALLYSTLVLYSGSRLLYDLFGVGSSFNLQLEQIVEAIAAQLDLMNIKHAF